MAAWARVSSASSRWYSASSAISGARCSRTPRPRWRSSRGPKVAACSTRYASAFTTRSSPRSSGSASNASTITRACARFRSPAPRASAVCVHVDPSEARQRRVPAYGPVVVAGLGRQPGGGGPVAGLLGDVVGGREHPQLLGHQRAPDPSDPQQELLPLTDECGTPDRSQPARPAHARPGREERRTCWTWNNPSTDHRHSSGLRTPCPQGIPSSRELCQSRSTITGAWSDAPLPARSSLSMKASVTRLARGGDPRTKSIRMPRFRSNRWR